MDFLFFSFASMYFGLLIISSIFRFPFLILLLLWFKNIQIDYLYLDLTNPPLIILHFLVFSFKVVMRHAILDTKSWGRTVQYARYPWYSSVYVSKNLLQQYSFHVQTQKKVTPRISLFLNFFLPKHISQCTFAKCQVRWTKLSDATLLVSLMIYVNTLNYWSCFHMILTFLFSSVFMIRQFSRTWLWIEQENSRLCSV